MGKCEVHTEVLGMVGTNVYLLTNKETSEALIVDPADEADTIIKLCDRTGSVPVAILLTHGHFDHMAAADELARDLDLPIYAYSGENALMRDVRANGSASLAGLRVTCTASREVTEGQMLRLAGFKIKVLHTPGHTAGSCCYYIEDEKVLFSGDTLFAGSYGRTDLPNGSQTAIVKSIKEKLLVLPPEVQVYPGHEDFTTIEQERKYNPVNF